MGLVRKVTVYVINVLLLLLRLLLLLMTPISHASAPQPSTVHCRYDSALDHM